MAGTTMSEFFGKLFDGSDFPARWHCGQWSTGHGWLHIGSDTAIFLAYIAIPLALLYTLRRRTDVPQPVTKMMALFVAFILLCGITHLNDAIIFWEPVYRWAGVTKLATAAVSWATVLSLVPNLPRLLALKTPTTLRNEVAETTKALREERDAAARELAARERAESALQEAEHRYRRLYHDAPDMYLSVDIDTGQILQCNKTAANRLGYSLDELVGMGMAELYVDEHVQRATSTLQQLKESKTLSNEQLVIKTKSGEHLWVSSSASAVEDADGHVKQCSLAWRDITDKKAAEELFAVAVEASPSAMIATDEEGRIILLNAESERLFGYSKVELLGQPVEVLLPSSAKDKHPQLRKAYNQNPTARQMGTERELEGRHKDGSTFPIEVGLNPIERDEGNMVLAAIVDRTEVVRQQRALQQQSAELQRSNADLESFAYAVSHDLKAPLRAIQNAASWVIEDLPREHLTADVSENLDMLIARAKRMEALLNALLQYSRAGRDLDPPGRIEVHQVVQEVVELLGLPLSVEVDSSTGTTAVFGSRAPLEQVFVNLISNAVKHRDREDLKIEVGCQIKGNYFEFFVRDNGPGIDPAHHKKVFEVFQTLKPRDEFESTGVGLALVKKVVETQGGQVRVESSLGNGATFYFTWPKNMQSGEFQLDVSARA